jgi:hypothetical protein
MGPTGPLHPLPVPDGHRDSVVMDFISPLPEDNRFNCLPTMTDCLRADIQIILTREVFTVPPLSPTDSAQTLLGLFLAECPAKLASSV